MLLGRGRLRQVRPGVSAAYDLVGTVPVQAHDRRVVLETAAVGVKNLRDQSAGGLAGVEIARAHDQGSQVDLHGAALKCGSNPPCQRSTGGDESRAMRATHADREAPAKGVPQPCP